MWLNFKQRWKRCSYSATEVYSSTDNPLGGCYENSQNGEGSLYLFDFLTVWPPHCCLQLYCFACIPTLSLTPFTHPFVHLHIHTYTNTARSLQEFMYWAYRIWRLCFMYYITNYSKVNSDLPYAVSVTHLSLRKCQK